MAEVFSHLIESVILWTTGGKTQNTSSRNFETDPSRGQCNLSYIINYRLFWWLYHGLCSGMGHSEGVLLISVEPCTCCTICWTNPSKRCALSMEEKTLHKTGSKCFFHCPTEVGRSDHAPAHPSRRFNSDRVQEWPLFICWQPTSCCWMFQHFPQ